jgi:hypothetical protein
MPTNCGSPASGLASGASADFVLGPEDLLAAWRA